MTTPNIAAILTWRDGSTAGVECRAREFVDAKEAGRVAVHVAEVFGECRVWYVRDGATFLHSRAVPHGQPARDPEVILGDSRL